MSILDPFNDAYISILEEKEKLVKKFNEISNRNKIVSYNIGDYVVKFGRGKTEWKELSEYNAETICDIALENTENIPCPKEFLTKSGKETFWNILYEMDEKVKRTGNPFHAERIYEQVIQILLYGSGFDLSE